MYNSEVFFFPTKIILVDDDSSFVKTLGLHLSKKFLVETHTDPLTALSSIKKASKGVGILNPHCILDEADEEQGDCSISLSKVSALASCADKSELSTLIIADYKMPEKNGIEFFEELSDVSSMKILLTGNADLDLALDAFNRKVVDKFLVKNSSRMMEEIYSNIRECQHAFFKEQSYPILTRLALPEDSLLNSREFCVHFQEVLITNDISEYYLLDKVGSYLLQTAKGKKVYFSILLDRQFDEYLDIAKTSRASSKLINMLEKRLMAPVFFSEADYKLPVSDWEKICYKFERKGEYYFSILIK